MLAERYALIEMRAENFNKARKEKIAEKKKKPLHYKLGSSYKPIKDRESAGGVDFPDDERGRFRKIGYIKVLDVF